MVYNKLHTGANTHAGGLKLGFIKVGNQVTTLERVTVPDKYPTPMQVTTKSRIFTYLFMAFFFKFNQNNATNKHNKKSIFALDMFGSN
jgi:hypothetical protein